MRSMLGALAHRGPDGEGLWSENGAWLGHRRLAVIDLTPAGDQPMISACGRYVIVVNGEIYNYPALRGEVERHGPVAWRGHSDIEVLLEAIAAFGIEEALARAQGMFALALWDRRERHLWLARDRLGEKPLCYSADGDGLTFASEVTGLEQVPDLTLTLDTSALSLYFRYGYIPGPLAVYREVRKVPPGCLLSWREGEAPRIAPYWELAAVVREGRRKRLTNDASAIGELDGLLRGVVTAQMVADVPVGVFLSGGIDSSLVAAVMQAVAEGPVNTFTMGFEVPEFNEAEHALAVARHLQTRHTQHTVTAADALGIVPNLGALFDEPFADASQIPTLLMSGMARRHVTVCLTGDGGDEMFGGYVRYPGVPRLWNAIRPWPLRGLASKALGAVPIKLLERALTSLGPAALQYTSRGKLGPSLRRAAGWLAAQSQEDLYELTMTAWPDPDRLFAETPPQPRPWRPVAPAFDEPVEAMMWRDSVDYLPGDILCKVDRSAMAHGLETRAPLLDPAIADFAWRAPLSMKLRGGQTKWLPRQVLDRYVPRDLIDRPKTGFSVPLHPWLTGPLRDWAQALLAPGLIARQGILNPKPVAGVWRAFLAGDSSQDHKVWSLLMFQSWMAARGR